MSNQPIKAFVSCSLRNEDQSFIDHICDILNSYGITTMGTVGKFSVAPENPIVSMNKNIDDADIVVICATPRYIQKDVKTGEVSNGLSEMIHVETGMALAYDKPVLLFVQEGTDVGNALPNITQYITLNGQNNDLVLKQNSIESLLENANNFIQKKQVKETWFVFKILAIPFILGALFYKFFFTSKNNKSEES